VKTLRETMPGDIERMSKHYDSIVAQKWILFAELARVSKNARNISNIIGVMQSEKP